MIKKTLLIPTLILSLNACNPTTNTSPDLVCNPIMLVMEILVTDEAHHSHANAIVTSTSNGVTYSLEFFGNPGESDGSFALSPDDYNVVGTDSVTVTEAGYASQTHILQKISNPGPCGGIFIEGETTFNLIPE